MLIFRNVSIFFVGFSIICAMIACSTISNKSYYPNIVTHLDTHKYTYISFDDLDVEIQTQKIEIHENDIIDVVENNTFSDNSIIYGAKRYFIGSDGIYTDSNGDRWKAMTVTTTAYTWMDDGVDHRIGAGDGKTSRGKDAIRTYGIAAGSPRAPYGSVIHVAGYGIYEVDDTGGALRQAWTSKREIVLDLRIPQRRYDGAWRSVSECRKIARTHGRNRNRVVLVKL